MYKLLKYGESYSVISGSLRNYYRDKIDNNDGDTSDIISFKHRANIIGKTAAQPPRFRNQGEDNHTLVLTFNVEVTIFLNTWVTFGDCLINCKIELNFIMEKRLDTDTGYSKCNKTIHRNNQH